MRIICIILYCILLSFNLIASKYIGQWKESDCGLPCYQYKGKLPFVQVDNNGNDSYLPEDPYFLLGNYKFTLITHVSGIFQLINAKRVWARANFNESQPNYGDNGAYLVVNGRKNNLIGVNSISADPQKTDRIFGVGFASYEYDLGNGLICTRTLSVAPSTNINSGNPAIIFRIVLKNNGEKSVNAEYVEYMPVNYVPMYDQLNDKDKRCIRYSSKVTIDEEKEIARCDLFAVANRYMTTPQRSQSNLHDFYPPKLYIQSVKGKGSVNKSSNDTLEYRSSMKLQAGRSSEHIFVMGFYDETFISPDIQTCDILDMANLENSDGVFAGMWKQLLPDFSDEKDDVMKREMIWNAHMIEASSKYSEYFNETFIPQGSVYSYHEGSNIANRDHLQAALGACYYNPSLTKSCLRYVMKQSERNGEIKRGNYGFGYSPASIYHESDEQLYMFNTVSEYLMITKDYSFLNELVEYYPSESGHKIKVIELLSNYFTYLRDEIGKGPNGLIKLLNSDWADSFLHRYSPNVYVWTAESHLNTTMALAVLPKFINVLRESGRNDVGDLISAIETYLTELDCAFMKDFGNRKFAARSYLADNLRFGVDNVCIEPQAYLLQIPTFSNERKKEIYDYVKERISAPEKIGVRNRERPLWDPKGGEDCGIWYSLEYPFLLGVATFDKTEAKNLLKKYSFDNFSNNYPQYWVGQWTAPDEINSTFYREGLYSFWIPIDNYRYGFQGYCSHPHTWPLYCYYKLYRD